ncbi:MAG: ABC transporter ATP-binding protein [Pseudomonadota bacterium]
MPAEPTPLISATEVYVRAGGTTLVERASLAINTNEVVVLLGPNGAGKTSFLRALLGITATQADVQLQGDPITGLTTTERALRVSYLPQVRETAWPNRVFDVIALGRFAQGVSLGNLSEIDAAATRSAIAACDLEGLSKRSVDTLSGGELARVHCARLYAAHTPLLIADEPTAGLDPQQQHRIAQLFQAYADATHGVLLVLHDLNLAMRYATRIVWMQEGRIVADTPPHEVTAELVSEVYQVKAESAPSAADGTRQFILAPLP